MGAGRQPRADDTQRERQVPALADDARSGFGRAPGAVVADRAGQEGVRLVVGEQPEVEAARAFQARQRAAAGGEDGSVVGAGQQRAHLPFALRVVEDDEDAAVGEFGPVAPGPFCEPIGDGAAAHPEGAQQ